MGRLAEGRRVVSCCRDLGDGYYVRVLYNLRRVDFRKYYVPYGYKITQIRPSTIDITMHTDEWNDFLQIYILIINKRYPGFANAKRCSYNDDHIGQFGWLSVWTRRALLLIAVDACY